MKSELVIVDEHRREVLTAVEQARAFVIASNDDMRLVDAHCAGLLRLKKRVEADFADSKATTYAAWKTVVAQEKGHLDGIEEARRIDKQKIGAWCEAQEKIRQEEERKAQVAARKKADDDALAAAEAAEKDGDKDAAQAILEAPVVVEPVVIAKTTPKAATIIRTVWKYRIVNPQAIPRDYLIPNDVAIGKVIRATEGKANIPGVQAYAEKC